MIEISKKYPEYNDIKWVIRARSTDKARQNLHYLHAEGNVICCTDSFRIHYYEMQYAKIPNGNYEIITTKDKIILNPVQGVNYPNVACIIPKDDIELCEYCEEDINSLMGKILRKLPASVCLNYKYVEDVIKDIGHFLISQSKSDEHSPILFENNNHMALIMPIRL